MRAITIHLDANIAPDDYAHVANAVWMLLAATGHDYTVEPDRKASVSQLDEVWDGYSGVSWVNGRRGGTTQARRAAKNPSAG